MNRTWQYSPKPVKMGVRDKEKISAKLQQFIDESGKIRQRVNRFEVKAGRVYLFHLVEQFGWDKNGYDKSLACDFFRFLRQPPFVREQYSFSLSMQSKESISQQSIREL